MLTVLTRWWMRECAVDWCSGEDSWGWWWAIWTASGRGWSRLGDPVLIKLCWNWLLRQLRRCRCSLTKEDLEPEKGEDEVDGPPPARRDPVTNGAPRLLQPLARAAPLPTPLSLAPLPVAVRCIERDWWIPDEEPAVVLKGPDDTVLEEPFTGGLRPAKGGENNKSFTKLLERPVV